LIQYSSINLQVSSANTQIKHVFGTLKKAGLILDERQYGWGNWWFALPNRADLDKAYYALKDDHPKEVDPNSGIVIKKLFQLSHDGLMASFNLHDSRRRDLVYSYFRFLLKENISEGTYISKNQLIEYCMIGSGMRYQTMRDLITKDIRYFEEEGLDFQILSFGTDSRQNQWLMLPSIDMLNEAYSNTGTRKHAGVKKKTYRFDDSLLEETYLHFAEEDPKEYADSNNIRLKREKLNSYDLIYIFIRGMLQGAAPGTAIDIELLKNYISLHLRHNSNTTLAANMMSSINRLGRNGLDIALEEDNFKLPSLQELHDAYFYIKTPPLRKQRQKKSIIKTVKEKSIVFKEAKQREVTVRQPRERIKNSIVKTAAPKQPRIQYGPRLKERIDHILSVHPILFAQENNIIFAREDLQYIDLAYILMKGLLALGTIPGELISRDDFTRYMLYGPVPKGEGDLQKRLKISAQRALKCFSQRGVELRQTDEARERWYALPSHMEIDKAYLITINPKPDKSMSPLSRYMLMKTQAAELPRDIVAILACSPRTIYEIGWILRKEYGMSYRIIDRNLIDTLDNLMDSRQVTNMNEQYFIHQRR
jgi:hypothetical protein